MTQVFVWSYCSTVRDMVFVSVQIPSKVDDYVSGPGLDGAWSCRSITAQWGRWCLCVWTVSQVLAWSYRSSMTKWGTWCLWVYKFPIMVMTMFQVLAWSCHSTTALWGMWSLCRTCPTTRRCLLAVVLETVRSMLLTAKRAPPSEPSLGTEVSKDRLEILVTGSDVCQLLTPVTDSRACQIGSLSIYMFAFTESRH